MAEMNTYSSSIPLPEYAMNMAVLLQTNSVKFSDKPIYQDVQNGTYTLLAME
jgi:hypothetical protein